MPRNSSGTYTLPAKNPVVTNTLIETAWANPTMSDLASALTDSLSRGGSGSMLSWLKIIDGSVSQPGLSFNADPSSGLYRAGAKDVRLSVGGADVVKWTDTAVTFPTGQILAPDGTAALPGYGFATQPSWGMFRVAGVGVGFSFNGAEMARIAQAGLTFSAGATFIGHSDTTTNISLVAASSLIDGVARIDCWDQSHATLPRQIYVRGRGIWFFDAVAANLKGGWSGSTGQGEFCINTNSLGSYSLANRGMLRLDGTAGSIIGLDYNALRCGYISGRGSAAAPTDIMISTASGLPLLLAYNGTEVARIDTDSTLKYNSLEVGYLDLNSRAASVATYIITAADRGKVVFVNNACNNIRVDQLTKDSIVTVFNNNGGGGTITLTAGSGVTFRWNTGTIVSTSPRSLALNGMVTLYWAAATSVVITGSGVS